MSKSPLIAEIERKFMETVKSIDSRHDEEVGRLTRIYQYRLTDIENERKNAQRLASTFHNSNIEQAQMKERRETK